MRDGGSWTGCLKSCTYLCFCTLWFRLGRPYICRRYIYRACLRIENTGFTSLRPKINGTSKPYLRLQKKVKKGIITCTPYNDIRSSGLCNYHYIPVNSSAQTLYTYLECRGGFSSKNKQCLLRVMRKLLLDFLNHKVHHSNIKKFSSFLAENKDSPGELASSATLFPWASAESHGCTTACWLIVPPALDVQTLATRYPRAYRRVPHSNGGSWNLRAGNKDR
jgi:hypothetical protein